MEGEVPRMTAPEDTQERIKLKPVDADLRLSRVKYPATGLDAAEVVEKNLTTSLTGGNYCQETAV